MKGIILWTIPYPSTSHTRLARTIGYYYSHQGPPGLTRTTMYYHRPLLPYRVFTDSCLLGLL